MMARKGPTQQEIDDAYKEGKQAFRADFGTHGPTLRPRATRRSTNPFPLHTKEREAWERGYNQDTRRVLE